MRISVAVAVLSAATYTLAADPAPIISGNPLDVVYTATLPKKPFFQAQGLDGNIRGFISGSAPPDGVGVRFTVRFENLPKTGGPFLYHIHTNKATNGNCTLAGAHLDPMNRGEKPACDASERAACQVGDLSGKYGTINSDPFTAEFVDPFTSLEEGTPAFFGNRSFVIHLANVTRVTCADFGDLEASFPNSTSTSTANTNSSTTTQCSTDLSSVTSSVCSTGVATSTSVSCSPIPTGTGALQSVPSDVAVPSPTVVVAAGTRMIPGLWLWCLVGVVPMLFSY